MRGPPLRPGSWPGRLRRHFLAALLALLGCAHGAEPFQARDTMQTLHFPDDYRGPGAHGYRESGDYARAKAFAMPPSLRVELGSLEVKPDRLLLPAALINDSAEAHELVVSAGVFSLEFAATAAVTKKPWEGPPMPPPAPVPPMLLEVPAHTRVELRGELYLPDWVWQGAPEVRLRWSFEAWNAPRPSGELRATLPGR